MVKGLLIGGGGWKSNCIIKNTTLEKMMPLESFILRALFTTARHLWWEDSSLINEAMVSHIARYVSRQQSLKMETGVLPAPGK